MRRNKRLRAESANVPVETDIVAYSQLNIPKMLQYFRDNQTIHRVTHIVIIAGKIADRGLNIVSTDYRWHLTHEILSPSKTAVVTELVQSGGRLCGVMDDHLESYLYVTQKDKEDLERGTTLQDQVLTEAQTHPETVLMQAFCEQVPLTRDMIPKRRTTRKRRVEPNWNYTEEKKEDENDAHYLDQFCSNLRRQIEQNEETVVRRVLRFMIAHSGSHLRNDIERTCNARDFRDITQWGGHRYYKILVRSGDRWKLNPSVVDRLTREQLMDRV
jgi:hypothetical protein